MAVAIFPGCHGISVDSNEVRSRLEVEQYAVYSAVLRERFIEKEIELPPIQTETMSWADDLPLLGDDYLTRTTREDRVLFLKEQIGPASLETLRDFDSRYRQLSNLSRKLDPSIDYDLVENPDSDSSSLIRLSNVGFNDAKTEALVRVNFRCLVLCGRGEFILLEKKNGFLESEVCVQSMGKLGFHPGNYQFSIFGDSF